jgi:SIR2-like domain
MIDPLVQLAFNLHENKGIYALLLGSGVSRTAGIPTGWEVILDLTTRLARGYGEDANADPVSWYRAKFEEDPSYSKLLEGLAAAPSERQNILRAYFEPDADERERGLKQPTQAHRSIAKLVSNGHIRVVLTANFDRLLETALEEAGVVPTVISTPDMIAGAQPIAHSKCTVIKLHGDYLDTRIKNTPTELETYDQRLNALLDRVLDDFGLIVCGWSGEWDTALRDAVLRAPNRRYSTYWTIKGHAAQAADNIIRQRQATTVAITDSDAFFSALGERVMSLEEINRPHPISAQIAVASAKRYLADDRMLIRLHDLVIGLTDDVLQFLKNNPPTVGRPLGKFLTVGARRIDASLSVLLPVLTNGVYWGKPEHEDLWAIALEKLTNQDRDVHNRWDALSLARYPAVLALYAMGMVAAERRKFALLRRLLEVPYRLMRTNEVTAVSMLPPLVLADSNFMMQLEGMDRRRLPLNDWIYVVLRDSVMPMLADPATYEHVFDRWEVLLSLAYLHLANDKRGWSPPGVYVYRRENFSRIVSELEASIKGPAGHSFFAANLFGANKNQCEQRISELKAIVAQISRW